MNARIQIEMIKQQSAQLTQMVQEIMHKIKHKEAQETIQKQYLQLSQKLSNLQSKTNNVVQSIETVQGQMQNEYKNLYTAQNSTLNIVQSSYKNKQMQISCKEVQIKRINKIGDEKQLSMYKKMRRTNDLLEAKKYLLQSNQQMHNRKLEFGQLKAEIADLHTQLHIQQQYLSDLAFQMSINGPIQQKFKQLNVNKAARFDSMLNILSGLRAEAVKLEQQKFFNAEQKIILTTELANTTRFANTLKFNIENKQKMNKQITQDKIKSKYKENNLVEEHGVTIDLSESHSRFEESFNFSYAQAIENDSFLDQQISGLQENYLNMKLQNFEKTKLIRNMTESFNRFKKIVEDTNISELVQLQNTIVYQQEMIRIMEDKVIQSNNRVQSAYVFRDRDEGDMEIVFNERPMSYK
ncbi:Hypothetical_protein [Hexamita inflata]|uniref:Hypothetical_protein n=1 Tax=Hexamita inflata TaxID=28002 RepID=A0ABP1HLB0_9EUKA